MDEIIHMENHTKKLKKKKLETRKSIDISSYKHSLLDFKIGHSSEVGKSFMLNEIVQQDAIKIYHIFGIRKQFTSWSMRTTLQKKEV